MYMYMYVCMYIYIYVYVHVWSYAYIYINIYVGVFGVFGVLERSLARVAIVPTLPKVAKLYGRSCKNVLVDTIRLCPQSQKRAWLT